METKRSNRIVNGIAAKRPALLLLLFGSLVAAASLVMRYDVSLDAFVEQEVRLRSFVADDPVTTFVVSFLLFVALSLIPGTTGKSIIYGWLFGMLAGLILVTFGLAVAAVIALLVVRCLFRDAVHSRFGSLVETVDNALERDGASYLVMLRLLHAPYTLVNYLSGATTVPVKTFWWATIVGMLPTNIAFVFAGSQLPSLQQVVEGGPWSVIDLPLLAALSASVLIPVAIRWFAGRFPTRAQRDLVETANESGADPKVGQVR